MNEPFNPARHLLSSQSFLQQSQPRFKAFFDLTPDKVSLSYFQYHQLAASAYGWQPDLVIELGRAYGNSTFAFAEALQHTGGRLVSLCNKDDWQKVMLPQIQHLTNAEWLSRIDARTVNNMVEVDLSKEIKAAKRVMIFWDAHGFQTAEYVLGHLLPLMQGKDCVVMMHDITELKHYITDPSYHQQRLWRSESANEGSVKVRIQGFLSSSEQLISVLDFCNRNNLALQSADESYRTALTPQQAEELKAQLGDGFSLDAHWVYFGLAKDTDHSQLHFPYFNRQLILSENIFREKYQEAYERQMASPDMLLLQGQQSFMQRLKIMLRYLCGR